MTDSVLTIEDLHLSFPIYRGEVPALNHVSLEIKRGEIVGVVGESGSGKSVTAMLAMRLLPEGSYRIHHGQVTLLGEDVLTASEKQLRQWRGAKVAMIFQEPMTALNPTRRIGKQMVEVIRQHQPLDRRAAQQKAIALLEEMQIPDAKAVMARYPFELSGGMRQRVMIALAFSCEPELIIADEPTTALDVTVQLQVLRLLKHKARASGTSVLFISHDMAVVSQLCDRMYVMYAGSVIESGATQTLIHHPVHPYSIGLLQCAPENGAPRELLPAIPGTVPNLSQLPQGCAFRERCFAAGADLNEMAEKDLPATLNDIRPQLWARINAFNKPLIAAVNGFALGAGCELALLCDVVIAGDNARFGLPEITLGIMPGAGGTQRLIRSVGKSLASKMVLTGESITAQQAQRAGLVSDVFPASLTLEYALKQAALMARHSPLALQAAKQALRQSQEVSLQAGLVQERQLFTLLSATEDRREGIDAFLQKRTPDFKGR